MPLIYALVSYHSTIIASHTSPTLTGNFAQVSTALLNRLDFSNDSKLSYSYHQYCFHYIINKGFVYLTIADELYNRLLAFHFLSELQNAFTAKKSNELSRAKFTENEFDSDMSAAFTDLFTKYNDVNNCKIATITNQLSDIHSTMLNNIDLAVNRNASLEDLNSRTENLSSAAFSFNRHSRTLKRKMWYRDLKSMMVLGSGLASVGYIWAASKCGGLSLPHC